MKPLIITIALLPLSAMAAETTSSASSVAAAACSTGCVVPGVMPSGATREHPLCIYQDEDRWSYEPCPALQKEDRSWHVLVQTYGGTVSLLKGLTHAEALKIAARLTAWMDCRDPNGCNTVTTPNTVKSAEVFQ